MPNIEESFEKIENSNQNPTFCGWQGLPWSRVWMSKSSKKILHLIKLNVSPIGSTEGGEGMR